MGETLFESQEVSGYNNQAIYDNRWYGQTFTPDETHSISSVDLRLSKAGRPGTETFLVEIYEADGDHKPTGDILVSGSFTKASVSADYAGDWLKIELTGASPTMTATTEYAIVLKPENTAGNSSTSVIWMTANSNIYAGGRVTSTTNGGASWITNFNDDFTFREYALNYDVIGELTASASITGTAFVSPAYISGVFSATASITGTADTKERFVPARRGDYDPDTFWDEETKAWVASQPIEKLAGGRHKTYLVVVSDQNLVYVGGL